MNNCPSPLGQMSDTTHEPPGKEKGTTETIMAKAMATDGSAGDEASDCKVNECPNVIAPLRISSARVG